MTDENVREHLDERFINVDPLRPSYQEMLDEGAERFEETLHDQTALLCIDLQYLDAARGYGVFAEHRDDVPEESKEYYFSMLENVVIPNVARLQAAFRRRGLEVIHTHIQSLTRDGRDRGRQHKTLDLLAPPGSKEAEIIPEVAPQGDEIVISKTASGVFTSTNMEFVLRNIGVTSLVIVGVYTDECVSTTARHACDLGFDTILVEDGCTSVTEQRHKFTVATLSNRYVTVLSTDELIRKVQRVIPADNGNSNGVKPAQ